MAIINAKYASKCNTCSKPVAVGQRVVWHRGGTGVSCCNPSLTAGRVRRTETIEARAEHERDFRPDPVTNPHGVRFRGDVGREIDRGEAALNKAMSSSNAAKGFVCPECGGSKIGDDGYDCKTCSTSPADPALVRNVDYIDRFGDEGAGDVYDPEDDPFR